MPNKSFAQGRPKVMKEIDTLTRLLVGILPFEMVTVIELSPGGDDTPATSGMPDAFKGDTNLTLGAVALERKKTLGKLIVIVPLGPSIPPEVVTKEKNTSTFLIESLGPTIRIAGCSTAPPIAPESKGKPKAGSDDVE